jgi:hypothetical protein
MQTNFYDSTGTAIAYAEDDDIFLFTGEPVAYVERDEVYAMSGEHLGWYEHGWLRDGAGDYVLFTTRAVGGPVRPRQLREPGKAPRRARPMRAWKQVAAPRPHGQHGWTRRCARDCLSP